MFSMEQIGPYLPPKVIKESRESKEILATKEKKGTRETREIREKPESQEQMVQTAFPSRGKASSHLPLILQVFIGLTTILGTGVLTSMTAASGYCLPQRVKREIRESRGSKVKLVHRVPQEPLVPQEQTECPSYGEAVMLPARKYRILLH